MRVIEYQDSYKVQWDDFITSSKNNIFMFHRDYMEYHKDRFHDHSLIFVDNNETIQALLPASSSELRLISHGGLTFGGFVTSRDCKSNVLGEAWKTCIDYCKERNISKLIYKPVPYIYDPIPNEADLYYLWASGANVIRRDLATTISNSCIFKLPKGRKAQINRAKREGVVVEESYDFSSFIDLENDVLRERHNTKATHTGRELELLASRFPENIKLFTAKRNGQLLAGAVLYLYPHIVHTQYLASSNEGRRIGALDLVIFHLLEKYKNSVNYFDFGISTEAQGKVLNEGLLAQKESFGGRSVIYDTYEIDLTK